MPDSDQVDSTSVPVPAASVPVPDADAPVLPQQVEAVVARWNPQGSALLQAVPATGAEPGTPPVPVTLIGPGDPNTMLVDDADQLSEAVGELLTRTETRTVLGEKARARAREFSWEQTANGVLDVLTAAVRGECVSGLVGGRPSIRGNAQASEEPGDTTNMQNGWPAGSA